MLGQLALAVLARDAHQGLRQRDDLVLPDALQHGSRRLGEPLTVQADGAREHLAASAATCADELDGTCAPSDVAPG
jgi:hypothetical protein